MKMQANNLENKNFDVTLELADNELGLGVGLIEFCFGVSKIITEMLDKNCKTQTQAKKASEVIFHLVTANVNKYVKRFNKIKEQEIENQMYELMEKMYTDWLNDTACMTEKEFMDIFEDSQELKLKPISYDNGINIYITNGKHEELITNITTDIIKNDRTMFEVLCMVTNTIATVIGDKILGCYINPFRNENEKILAENIRKMI